MDETGFAKAILEKDTGRILGFHIIGPEASVLIQEVVNAVANKAGVGFDRQQHTHIPLHVGVDPRDAEQSRIASRQT